MKKKYISPEITMIKLHTENVMAGMSDVRVTNYEGKTFQDNEINISKDIEIWKGEEIETAKDNGGNDLWDNVN